jgi:hypothetical protein
MQKSCNRIDGVRYAAVGCVDSVSPGRRSHQVPKHVSSGGLTSGTGIPRPDLFSTWRSYGRHSLSLMLRHLASNHQNPDHVSPSLKQQANISTLGPWVSIFLYLLDHVNLLQHSVTGYPHPWFPPRTRLPAVFLSLRASYLHDSKSARPFRDYWGASPAVPVSQASRAAIGAYCDLASFT